MKRLHFAEFYSLLILFFTRCFSCKGFINTAPVFVPFSFLLVKKLATLYTDNNCSHRLFSLEICEKSCRPGEGEEGEEKAHFFVKQNILIWIFVSPYDCRKRALYLHFHINSLSILFKKLSFKKNILFVSVFFDQMAENSIKTWKMCYTSPFMRTAKLLPCNEEVTQVLDM